MLVGSDVAEVGDDASGVTFAHSCYVANIKGKNYNIWDTVGLSEANGGRVSAQQSEKNLCDLVRSLKGGVHLLVYVTRQRVPINTDKYNYQMFHVGLCERIVPVVIVITGLEEITDMDSYWNENRSRYQEAGCYFRSSACITSFKGPWRNGGYIYEDEYNDSVFKMHCLIEDYHSSDPLYFPDLDTRSQEERFLRRVVKSLPTYVAYALGITASLVTISGCIIS